MTDTLSLLAMIVVMFVLRWDFALIALGVTPLLATFVLRVNKAVRTAVTEVRTRQSDLLTTMQEGLQSIEVVKAFTREDRREQPVQKMSMQTVTARLTSAPTPSPRSVDTIIVIKNGTVVETAPTNNYSTSTASTHNYTAYNSAMHIAKQFTYTSKPALTRR